MPVSVECFSRRGCMSLQSQGEPGWTKCNLSCTETTFFSAGMHFKEHKAWNQR